MTNSLLRKLRAVLPTFQKTSKSSINSSFKPKLELMEDRLTPSSTGITNPGLMNPHEVGNYSIVNESSSNWAGYAVSPSSGQVNSVGGTWLVQPPLSSPSNAVTSVWVGIDGFSNGTVEQIGTSANIQNGKVSYNAWVEFFGDTNGTSVGQYYYQTNIPITIKAGDTVSAMVSFLSTNGSTSTFQMYMKDVSASGLTQYYNHNLSTTYVAPARGSAEWIVEAPFGSKEFTLANVGNITFSGAWSTIGTSSGSIGSFSSTPITMTDPSGGTTSNPTNPTTSATGGIGEPSGGGSSTFSVRTYPGTESAYITQAYDDAYYAYLYAYDAYAAHQGSYTTFQYAYNAWIAAYDAMTFSAAGNNYLAEQNAYNAYVYSYDAALFAKSDYSKHKNTNTQLAYSYSTSAEPLEYKTFQGF